LSHPAFIFLRLYDKSQGMETIRDDDKREPLFDSPPDRTIPIAGAEVERYVRALAQKDVASLALLLGMYDDSAETKTTLNRVLEKYGESLDISTVKVDAKGYVERENRFIYELRDDNHQVHELSIIGEELKIVDEWAEES